MAFQKWNTIKQQWHVYQHHQQKRKKERERMCELEKMVHAKVFSINIDWFMALKYAFVVALRLLHSLFSEILHCPCYNICTVSHISHMHANLSSITSDSLALFCFVLFVCLFSLFVVLFFLLAFFCYYFAFCMSWCFWYVRSSVGVCSHVCDWDHMVAITFERVNFSDAEWKKITHMDGRKKENTLGHKPKT